MSEKRHAVKVSIVGEEFTIRSDETPEHTRAVAEHVDRAIKQVLNTSPVIEMQKAAILAALQITDQLLKSRAARQDVEDEIDALSTEVRRWLPPAKRGESGDFPAVT
ncbi:MAG: cell division protein ZapA [Gemmatimonadetes bacterium]|nr:cell division protein ZapA [Gemmatimonadota bacterium]